MRIFKIFTGGHTRTPLKKEKGGKIGQRKRKSREREGGIEDGRVRAGVGRGLEGWEGNMTHT
jgi:hypothetical protein